MKLKTIARVAPRSIMALWESLQRDITWGEERRLQRLLLEPRHTTGTITLMEHTVTYIDSASLVSNYRAIFGSHVYAFAPRDGAPLIIDGGANIGLASVYWSRRHPNCRILAFEPDEAAFAALEKNVSEFAIDRISLRPEALWTSEGTLGFNRTGGDAGHLDTEDGHEAVRTIPLASVLEEPVGLLKLDIEGAETEALLSAGDSLRNASHLVVEYHSFVSEPQRLDSILRRLSDLSFRYWLKTEYSPRRPLVEVESDHDMDLRVHVMATRRQ